MSLPILILAALLATATSQQLVNQKVDRLIDLSTQLVRVTSKIQVANAAGQGPASSYKLLFRDPQRLSFVRATIASPTNEKDRTPLSVQRVTGGSSTEWEEWTVDLSEHPIAGGSVSPLIEVYAVFTKLLIPHPAEIDQSDKQLVVYDGNHYFFSPYLTVTQSTKIKIPAGSQIESYSKLKPNAQSSNTIDFGPYENIAPKSYSKMLIHYENNSPFLTVTRLDRAIEVSHWAGVISVEEEIDVRHEGAVLRGSFSRYDFQREANSGVSAVKNFKTKLPASASDVYYRDEIGNISTSHMRKTSSQVVLDLRPRFPLFGGWKTHYILGYALPAIDYLFNDGNQFIVRVPFVGHVFDNSVIDDCTVRVILPEGAADIKLRLPFSVTRDRDQVQKTYLDTIGRTVIVLRKSNLVENHVQDFEVHYSYNRLWMLQVWI
jgi:oligosaccharyltransferase complex subunit alpha (ribophorin I)